MIEKEAFKEATRLLIQKTTEARAQHEWAFNDCTHDHIRSVSAPDYTHQVCLKCGAERIIRP